MSPYIKQKLRDKVDVQLDDIIMIIAGHDNKDIPPFATYVVYKLLKRLFAHPDAKWNWKAEAFKVLSAADKEYNQCIIVPHEKKARSRNGDI